MRKDQRGLTQLRDHVRHRECLACASRTKQRCGGLASFEIAYQLSDRSGLVAHGGELGDDFELSLHSQEYEAFGYRTLQSRPPDFSCAQLCELTYNDFHVQR